MAGLRQRGFSSTPRSLLPNITMIALNPRKVNKNDSINAHYFCKTVDGQGYWSRTAPPEKSTEQAQISIAEDQPAVPRSTEVIYWQDVTLVSCGGIEPATCCLYVRRALLEKPERYWTQPSSRGTSTETAQTPMGQHTGPLPHFWKLPPINNLHGGDEGIRTPDFLSARHNSLPLANF